MEVENHNNSLPGLDIFKAFGVSFVDYQRSLHSGDCPMPRNPFSIGVHETDRYHSDEQFRFLLSCLLPRRISTLLL